MSHVSELRDRVEARKKQLEAKLLEWKADTKGVFQKKIDEAEKDIADLKDLVKDGWEKVSEPVAKKINDWLKKDNHL